MSAARMRGLSEERIGIPPAARAEGAHARAVESDFDAFPRHAISPGDRRAEDALAVDDFRSRSLPRSPAYQPSADRELTSSAACTWTPTRPTILAHRIVDGELANLQQSRGSGPAHGGRGRTSASQPSTWATLAARGGGLPHAATLDREGAALRRRRTRRSARAAMGPHPESPRGFRRDSRPQPRDRLNQARVYGLRPVEETCTGALPPCRRLHHRPRLRHLGHDASRACEQDGGSRLLLTRASGPGSAPGW